MPLDYEELSRRQLRFAIEELTAAVKELTKALNSKRGNPKRPNPYKGEKWW